MARPLRIEYPGGVYHITSRGNAQQPIFLSDIDRGSFLNILSSVINRCNWLCHAYCLMDNHYHLLIETPEGNLSKGMRQLNGVYTQWFNRNHGRVGHIFQGRYKAIVVEKEAYLLELCRYMVLNPVRAAMVDKPDKWAWSSYRSTAGLKKGQRFLTTDWILGQFAGNRSKAERLCRSFIKEGIVKESPWKELKGQIYLGGMEFIDRLKAVVRKVEGIKEIPRVQRYASRPGLSEIIKKDVRFKRDESIYKAHVGFGYSLKEIADYLDLHYTTVSKVINAMGHKK